MGDPYTNAISFIKKNPKPKSKVAGYVGWVKRVIQLFELVFKKRVKQVVFWSTQHDLFIKQVISCHSLI
jgi:hypothetical protein